MFTFQIVRQLIGGLDLVEDLQRKLSESQKTVEVQSIQIKELEQKINERNQVRKILFIFGR